jgi:hypothetical protein
MTSNEISLTAKAEVRAKLRAAFPPKLGVAEGPVKVSVGANAKIDASVGVAGKVSHKGQQINTDSLLVEKRMIRTSAKCAVYTASISYGDMPEPDPTFLAAIRDVADSQSAYNDLFEEYGTHFLDTVKMGARFGTTFYVTNTKFESIQKETKGFGASVEASASASVKLSVGATVKVAGVKVVAEKNGSNVVRAGVMNKGVSTKATANLLSPKEQMSADAFSNAVSDVDVSSVGAPIGSGDADEWMKRVGNSPVPIRFETQEICRHPAFGLAGKEEQCAQYAGSYCKTMYGADACTPQPEAQCFGDLDCEGDQKKCPSGKCACRKGNCVAVPVCMVTMYRDAGQRGGSYQWPGINHEDNPNGKVFDLRVDNWNDDIESVRLSDGCNLVELADDDGTCGIGQADNIKTSKSTLDLPWDLQDDVCVVKVWAKDVDGADGRRRTSAKVPKSLDEAVTAFAESAADHPEPTENSSACHIHTQTDFVPNIGKGMYGYNHHFASPISTEQAGTDPGFKHRRLWDVDYTQCQTAELVEFKALPGGQRRRADSTSSVLHGPSTEKTFFVPDGWTVRKGVATACEAQFEKPDVSESSFDYQDKVKDSWKLTLTLPSESAVSYSTESEQFAKNNGEEKKMLVQTSAECVDYIMQINSTNPPTPSKSFKFIVDQLTDSVFSSAEAWYKFFDMFGLSYPRELIFGARYGYSMWLDQQEYTIMSSTSEKTTVSATVAYATGPIGAKISATAASTEETTTSSNESVSNFFQEIKEFSLGARMPKGPNISAWTNIVGVEPMPVRYDFLSICEHPALNSKKRACKKRRDTYCTEYLNAENPAGCEPQPKPECLWDVQCPDHHDCNEGKCEEQPSCEITVYSDNNYQGSRRKTYGPVYWQQAPAGKVFTLGDMEDYINSAKWTGGCEEVLFFDEDNCREFDEDNIAKSNRQSDAGGGIGDIKWDLQEDTCKVKLMAKKQWYRITKQRS